MRVRNTNYQPNSCLILRLNFVSICFGVFCTYSLASFNILSFREPRYFIMLSSFISMPVSSAKCSGLSCRAVHTTASRPFFPAHCWIFSSIPGSALQLDAQSGRVTKLIHPVSVASLALRFSMAASRSPKSALIHMVWTSSALGYMTSVILPPLESLMNSIGRNGPSFFHSPLVFRLRGSHISEPQPKNAISIVSCQ